MGRLLNDVRSLVWTVIITVLDMIFVLCLITGTVILLSAYKERVTGEPQFICGYKTIYVSSGSMEDTIKKGQMVMVRRMDGLEAEPGDILFFRRGSQYVIHRYIGYDAERKAAGERNHMITKGDNNDIEDVTRLAPEDVLGKVML